jgi:hypothetical protein
MEQVTSITNRGASYPYPLTLRAGAQRALKTLGFDASGNPMAAFCASAKLCLGEISAWPCRHAPYLMRELFRYLIHICY